MPVVQLHGKINQRLNVKLAATIYGYRSDVVAELAGIFRDRLLNSAHMCCGKNGAFAGYPVGLDAILGRLSWRQILCFVVLVSG